MRVVGPPRSGTNLVKFLVELNTPIKCRFDIGWWKHALISPRPSDVNGRRPELPTVIMFREPVAQLVALFRLPRQQARAFRGADSMERFAETPVVMQHPDLLIDYRFPSPVEYLVQYYHAALSWDFPGKVFIDLADLRSSPATLSPFLQSCFGGQGMGQLTVLPAGYLGRNPDTDFTTGVRYEEGTTVEAEEGVARKARAELLPFVLPQIECLGLGQLHDQLRLQRLQPPR